MKFILFILFSIFIIFAEEKSYGTICVSSVDTVYDGDTFYATIKSVHPIIGNHIGVRIYGIDTPEITSKDSCVKAMAIKAKQYLNTRLKNARRIYIVNVKRDKYFRLLADVYIGKDNIGDELVKLGYAITYDGGKKSEWFCNK